MQHQTTKPNDTEINIFARKEIKIKCKLVNKSIDRGEPCQKKDTQRRRKGLDSQQCTPYSGGWLDADFLYPPIAGRNVSCTRG
jgi:hypothetical protein